MVRRASYRSPARLLGAVALLAGAAGCVDVDVPESLDSRSPTTTVPDAAQPEAAQPEERGCVSSLRPEGPAGTDVEPGSYMDEIQQQQVLRVGVDVGTPGFSSVDRTTGEPEGFDVDIAREVADALLGDPEAVEFVLITAGERIDALTEGRVDLVAHNFTISCSRWEEISFSTEYFVAGQKVLVRTDSPAESLDDLDNRRVCATAGSTALDHMANMTTAQPLPVRVPDRADCLVLLQQGQVDAAATDDAILAGLAAQDPNLELRGEAFSEEPYGLGLPPDHPEWVRYVNAVLEDVRESGRWDDLREEWLADIPGLEVGDDPPAPTYDD